MSLNGTADNVGNKDHDNNENHKNPYPEVVKRSLKK